MPNPLVAGVVDFWVEVQTHFGHEAWAEDLLSAAVKAKLKADHWPEVAFGPENLGISTDLAGGTLLLAVVKLLDKLFKFRVPEFLSAMREKAAGYKKAPAADNLPAPTAAAPGGSAPSPVGAAEKAGDSEIEAEESGDERPTLATETGEMDGTRYFVGDVVRLSCNVGVKYKRAEAIVTRVTRKLVKVDVVTGSHQHKNRTFPAKECTLVRPSTLRESFQQGREPTPAEPPSAAPASSAATASSAAASASSAATASSASTPAAAAEPSKLCDNIFGEDDEEEAAGKSKDDKAAK